jgi:hypothetical protein
MRIEGESSRSPTFQEELRKACDEFVSSMWSRFTLPDIPLIPFSGLIGVQSISAGELVSSGTPPVSDSLFGIDPVDHYIWRAAPFDWSEIVSRNSQRAERARQEAEQARQQDLAARAQEYRRHILANQQAMSEDRLFVQRVDPEARIVHVGPNEPAGAFIDEAIAANPGFIERMRGLYADGNAWRGGVLPVPGGVAAPEPQRPAPRVRVHLKKRDGWSQTRQEPSDWSVQTNLILPEQEPARAQSIGDDAIAYVGSPITRRDFELVKSAVFTDHRTNISRREYWYEERG